VPDFIGSLIMFLQAISWTDVSAGISSCMIHTDCSKRQHVHVEKNSEVWDDPNIIMLLQR